MISINLKFKTKKILFENLKELKNLKYLNPKNIFNKHIYIIIMNITNFK